MRLFLFNTFSIVSILNWEKIDFIEEKRRENILVDELTLALEKERSLRQFCEQQLRELQAASPLISPISLSVTPQLHLGASIINSPAVGSHTTIAGSDYFLFALVLIIIYL